LEISTFIEIIINTTLCALLEMIPLN